MSHGTPADQSVAKESGDPPPPPPSIESRPSDEPARQEETALRLALEAGEVGTWEWDIDSGKVQWSENLEQIHGLAPGSFDRTFEGYRALIHPDDRERVLAAIRGCIEGRTSYEVEFRSADTTRGPRWVFGRGRVLAGQGAQSARMVGVCMDITGRKRVEEAAWEA